MSKIYAISDIHGCIDVFEQALSVVDLSNPESQLILLGDYVPHYTVDEPIGDFVERASEALRYVKGYCEEHAGQAVALKGNHEDWTLQSTEEGLWTFERDLVVWMRYLPLFCETETQIFVHAGVDEEAEDLWRVGTDDTMLCWKFPPTFGPFIKDVIAGHVGTHHMFGEWGEHDVFWDGQSHYYIDGTTEHSGVMPVLIYDTETGRYSSRLATADGVDYENPVLAHTPAQF